MIRDLLGVLNRVPVLPVGSEPGGFMARDSIDKKVLS